MQTWVIKSLQWLSLSTHSHLIHYRYENIIKAALRNKSMNWNGMFRPCLVWFHNTMLRANTQIMSTVMMLIVSPDWQMKNIFLVIIIMVRTYQLLIFLTRWCIKLFSITWLPPKISGNVTILCCLHFNSSFVCLTIQNKNHIITVLLLCFWLLPRWERKWFLRSSC